ncbi:MULTISPECIES: GNAT family N-acetyltransferase [Metabacillus]|uniref:GNAT family N-acetyltransferase n=3 Tax=Metabacillus TaxID=2675233 RepID=A0A179T738_9BACI|nr:MULTISPECIES: GNAT family N-acetyltransferase [Metabacillus]OAS88999.1 GNAT family N-acetyltransferase [Metabacillus litoralis]QNF28501.1 GNAT family N-acetyltransferase [Metabacillus sp. KUDC1714]
MNVKQVTTKDQLEDAYSVRRTVFVDEQQVPEEEEIDQFEDDATHIVLYDNEVPVGAARLRVLDGIGKLERICVLSSSRKNGAGKLLVNKLEEIAIEQGVSKLKLNAQTHAIPFYERLGYETVSDIFMDAGIPHVTMIKHAN